MKGMKTPQSIYPDPRQSNKSRTYNLWSRNASIRPLYSVYIFKFVCQWLGNLRQLSWNVLYDCLISVTRPDTTLHATQIYSDRPHLKAYLLQAWHMHQWRRNTREAFSNVPPPGILHHTLCACAAHKDRGLPLTYRPSYISVMRCHGIRTLRHCHVLQTSDSPSMYLSI
jgi:hypothetical protein